MARGFLLRRLGRTLVVIFGAVTAVFFIARLTGDPAQLMMAAFSTPQDVERFRRVMGFDRPLWQQYLIFMGSALGGDLGRSFQYQMPTAVLVLERLPATFELAFGSLLLATLLGIPLGVVAAARRNTLLDWVSMGLSLLGQSMPIFWLGIMLILIFGVFLQWLPSSGRGTLAHLILPTVTLGTYSAASIARLTRSAVIEVLHQDYVRTARAKGVSEFRVVLRHALRNAFIPVVTVVGLQLGTVLGGAVVTETIFAWPGVGWLTVSAIHARDFPLVQASVVLSALSFVVINFLVDVAYFYLDPRIRYV